jgi:phenylpropionate dioxygenase-like ring-hydroxylating dioxygenase large terminal subunit
MISATPKSWYFGCSSKELKPGEHKLINLGQNSVLLVRYKDGTLRSFSGRCPHMNTELKTGYDNRSEKIVCPMHNWVFDKSGKCVGIPGSSSSCIPTWAQLETYPTQEKWGSVFFFYGAEPSFSLPFFEELEIQQTSWSSAFSVSQNNKWYMAAANGFDLHHFQYVHHRHVLKHQVISSDSKFNRNISIQFENRSQKLQDYLMRFLFGKCGQLDFSVWGGNFVLATLRQGNLRNHMMIINSPTSETTSQAHFILFKSQKSGFNIFDKLLLRVQSFFTRIFFEDEARMAGGVDLPKNPGPRDEVLWEYKVWLESISDQKMI